MGLILLGEPYPGSPSLSGSPKKSLDVFLLVGTFGAPHPKCGTLGSSYGAGTPTRARITWKLLGIGRT